MMSASSPRDNFPSKSSWSWLAAGHVIGMVMVRLPRRSIFAPLLHLASQPCQHAALGHINGAGRYLELGGSFLWTLSLLRRQQKRLPGRFLELATDSFHRPAQDALLVF